LSRLHTSFVLGYHGCDEEVGKKALFGDLDLIQSDRNYDWLGPGIYFWESDPVRALEWAKDKVTAPYVLGAVIDLGNCLDLTVRQNLELVRGAFDGLVAARLAEGKPIPRNRDSRRDVSRDKLLRELDCAVIRYLHDSIELQRAAGGEAVLFKPFDTVRGLFREGEPIYPESGFYERTHTQIAVRSLSCIKGLFQPPR
jgi:hypothetical protein